MSRPKGLDLFCGAGGCSQGYHDAGFDMVGVDLNPQPHYPFEFVKAEALGFIKDDLRFLEFDFIHASPPCQAHTGVPNRRDDHYDVLAETRELLIASGLPLPLGNRLRARRTGSFGSPLPPVSPSGNAKTLSPARFMTCVIAQRAGAG